MNTLHKDSAGSMRQNLRRVAVGAAAALALAVGGVTAGASDAQAAMCMVACWEGADGGGGGGGGGGVFQCRGRGAAQAICSFPSDRPVNPERDCTCPGGRNDQSPGSAPGDYPVPRGEGREV